MSLVPTPEQHRALLHDCWEVADALPGSGVLNRADRPYRALRFERRLKELENDPVGLLAYIRGMARRTSEGLDALVKYNRIELSVETLIDDESKPYAPLFTADDREAARAKLHSQAAQVVALADERARQLEERDRAVIADMNVRRIADGRPSLTPDQEAIVLDNRRKNRTA